MTIKEIIKTKKEEMNITTEELAIKSGVPKGTLNKILSGETKDPKISTLKALAKIFEISISEFNEEEENINISKEELNLIKNFRKLSKEGKEYVIKNMEIVKEMYKKDENFLKDNIS